jgi:signal transduction histidine kinase/ActR/RegA family two-component response regulator
MTEQRGELAQLLWQERDRIVERFVAELRRRELAPPGTSRSLLIDHIPRFLEEMIAEASALAPLQAGDPAMDTSETARQHGEQRWELGYDLDALIREYEVLQQCILRTAKEAGVQLSVDEMAILAKCSSTGVAEAAAQYIQHRDQQLNHQKEQLIFLAEAGQVLSSSLDYRSTLARVTALSVPRLGDGCAVYLEQSFGPDFPVSHVQAWKADLIREIHDLFPPSRDSTAGGVLHTGRAAIFSELTADIRRAMAQTPKHLELLEKLDVRSLMIVPLRAHEHVFGALALMHTESGRRYGDQDLVLASELASHASVAIDNARLYHLSQRERARVEAATRAKDEFVAMVSHELRTPLHAILGWVDLLRKGDLTEGKRTHALEVVARNAQAQNQLVSDLLDISRAITGRLRITPSQIDLSDVIDMAVESVRPAAEAKRIAIAVQVECQSSVLRGDADRLQQVVWNLLVNAVKFTAKGGRITVRLQTVGSELELNVEDTGVGIDPDFLPHIFDTFRQFEVGAARRHGGLGIGLSIAKHIVELHGGTILARSPGKGLGATLTVRVPISPVISTAYGITKVPATKAQTQSSDVPSSGKGIQVLVVDDDADGRELIAVVLEASGMEVRVAGNVAEALAVLETQSPDVVVSDIGMPDEDGYSLVRKIRTLTNEELQRVPAIALTAFASNEDRTRALVAGFNAHLAKPAEPATLVRTVLELAGRVPPVARAGPAGA